MIVISASYCCCRFQGLDSLPREVLEEEVVPALDADPATRFLLSLTNTFFHRLLPIPKRIHIKHLFFCAFKAGNLELLKWSLEGERANYPRLEWSNALFSFARRGHLDAVRFLMQCYAPKFKSVIRDELLHPALRSGNMALADFLLGEGASPRDTACLNAAISGCEFDFVVDLVESYEAQISRKVLGKAFKVADSDLAFYDLLAKSNRLLSENELNCAAASGDVELFNLLLKEFTEKRKSIPSDLLVSAVRSKNLAMVEVALGCAYQSVISAVAEAIRLGLLKMAEFLLPHVERSTMLYRKAEHNIVMLAVRTRNRKFIESIFSSGYQPSYSCCTVAASMNDLPLLLWLKVSMECELRPKDALTMACQHGSVEIVDYLLKHEGVSVRDDAHIVRVAVERRQLAVAKFLIENGATVAQNALYSALSTKNLEMVKLLCMNKTTEILTWVNDNNIPDSH